MGDFLEGAGVGFNFGGGERTDAACGIMQQAHGGIFVHDRQCALDLLEGGTDGAQDVGAARGPEETVEVLLDFGQGGTNLVGELAADLARL